LSARAIVAAVAVAAVAVVVERHGVDGAFVHPADDEVEDFWRVVGHDEGGGGGFFEGAAEGGVEEGRAVAEQRLVQLVVFSGRADVEVDHAAGEEPGSVSVSFA